MSTSSRLLKLRSPVTFAGNIAFVIAASVFLAITAWLMQAEVIPSLAETALSLRYSPWSFIPIAIWMQLAVILSLILPIFALLLCWRKAIVRRTLLFYIGLLLIQIPTEMACAKAELPGMNFIVGFVYTTYRVWQLWCYQQQIDRQPKFSGIRKNFVLIIFWAGIIFWMLNWLILGINLVTRIVGT